MKVWIVKAGENHEGLDIAFDDGRRALVFADTEQGYSQAFDAWKALVKARLGVNPVYSYPGEIGHMARVEVIARQHPGYDMEDYVDVVELRSYDVIGA